MRTFISINSPVFSIDFKGLEGKFKVVENKNLHLTLKFLGEITANDAKEISKALNFIENEKKFKISLKGIGVFPNENYARILWVGVEEGYKEICELQKKIDNALSSKFPPEKDFVPHLTIARIKYINRVSLRTFIEKYKNFEFLKFTVEKVSLMKSDLREEGPIYTEINCFLLRD